jgi:hypothetical protein
VFGKRKLRKHGAKAQAVVVDCDMGGLSNNQGAHKWKLDLRVQFEDGTTVETSTSAWEINIGMGYGPGQILPVFYDPDDRSKVVVDEETLKAEHEARKEAGRAGLVKIAEEKLARGEGPPQG